MFRFAAALVACGLLVAGLVRAGADGLKVGDTAPTFSNLPGIDGKNHSLSDYKDKDVLVVAITCNHCPVAVAYEKRFVDFTKKHAGPGSKVGFVAINVNTLPADKLDKMIIRAQEQGFNFPYLYDESQQIGKALSAKVTPELYVLNKDRKVVYWGSFDDSQNSPKTNYVEQAVTAALQGQAPATPQTKPFGCSVKYEKK